MIPPPTDKEPWPEEEHARREVDKTVDRLLSTLDADDTPLHIALPAMLIAAARLGAESVNPDPDLVQAFEGLLADARLENAKKTN